MHTQVSVSTPTTGPIPQLNRRTVPDPSDPTGEKKQEESKSFIVKYWYIIVPLLLMSLISTGPAENDANKSSQGRSQQATRASHNPAR
ncbi:hypothetical protein IWQ62_002579 [Dispira parvispora]|uniref:Uncharacterized protein n=1 Tax=Dispira parvispora TaxID=1520584 RepID=A0A9W8AVF6_9FUNG|nr:hypothetical protein IWQ62_002579 [Dispira parvispora]